MPRIILILLTLFVAKPSFAALLVELIDRHKEITTLTFQDGWMRGISPNSDYVYTLMNLQAKRIYIIDMGDKTNTEVSRVFMRGSPHPFEITELGAGPKVADRETKKYQITNQDGEKCASIYLWEGELEEELVLLKGLLEKIKIDPESLLPALGPLADGLMPECVRAEMDALGILSQKGLIAMRINQKGETTLKIQKIQRTQQSIPSCMMTPAKHYQPETPPSLAMEMIVRRLFGGRDKPAKPLTNACP